MNRTIWTTAFALLAAMIAPAHAAQPPPPVALSEAAGEANATAAPALPPPPPVPEGQAGYVGNEACADRHDDAIQLWKQTRHANARETRV